MHLGLGADIDAARRFIHHQHLGLRGEPLGEYDLLLVAAGERSHDVGKSGVLHLESDRPVQRAAALGLPVHQTGAGGVGEAGEADVALDGHVHHQSLGPAVLRYECQARGHRHTGGAWPEFLSEHLDLTSVEPVHAEHGARHFASSGADESRQADDLASPYFEGDVGEDSFAGQPPHGEGNLARLGVLLRIELVEIAADHPAHEVVLGESVEEFTADQGAVAQGRHALAQLEDLFQAV